MSASRCLTAWNAPIGCPKATRSLAYSLVMARQAAMAPHCSAASARLARSAAAASAAAASPASGRAGVSVEPDPGQRPGVVDGWSAAPGSGRPAAAVDQVDRQPVSAPAAGTSSTLGLRRRSAPGPARRSACTPSPAAGRRDVPPAAAGCPAARAAGDAPAWPSARRWRCRAAAPAGPPRRPGAAAPRRPARPRPAAARAPGRRPAPPARPTGRSARPRRRRTPRE